MTDFPTLMGKSGKSETTAQCVSGENRCPSLHRAASNHTTGAIIAHYLHNLLSLGWPAFPLTSFPVLRTCPCPKIIYELTINQRSISMCLLTLQQPRGKQTNIPGLPYTPSSVLLRAALTPRKLRKVPDIWVSDSVRLRTVNKRIKCLLHITATVTRTP